MKLSRRGWVVAVACSAALVSCSEPAAPADGTYVARSGGVLVALVAADDEVTAYACDGDADSVSLAIWLHGQLEGGRGTLAGDGSELDLEFAGDAVTGELRPATGDPLPLEGARATGDAGLYWAESADYLGGWIFDVDGTQRGAVLKRNTGDVASLIPLALSSPQQTEVTVEEDTLAVMTFVSPAPVH